MAKLLVVHPGASWSTHDVYIGLYGALAGLGVDLVQYALDLRIERSVSWLQYCYEQAVKTGAEAEEPSQGDYWYQATQEIITRALLHQVDAVLIISAMYVPLTIMRMLHQAGIVTGIVLTESPYDDERQAQWIAFADIAWTNEVSSIVRLQAANEQTYYLPAAYDPVRHQPEARTVDEQMPTHDVVFVGSGFQERLDLLAAVDWSGVDLALYGQWDMVLSVPDHPLRRYIKANVVDNDVAAMLYRRSKISLNLYRTSIGFEGDRHITTAQSLNPRAYELAATGCCQVSQWRPEIDRVLPSGVAIFNGSSDDLGRVVRQLLANPDMRAGLVRSALTAVQGHTFQTRATRLMEQFMPVIRQGGRHHASLQRS